MVLQMSSRGNREFLSCPKPLFQIEVKCEVVNMEKIVSFHSNETRFPKKDFAFSLVLKVRVFGTRKWPIGRDHPFSLGRKLCQTLDTNVGYFRFLTIFCVSPFRIIVTFSGCCYCQEYTYFCANSGSNQEASLSR